MATSPDFLQHASGLLAPAGHVVAKRMFGGHGVYLNGLFMTIIIDDELSLKAGVITRAAIDTGRCAPMARLALVGY